MTRMQELAEFLKSHEDFCLLGHLHPDGDTAGCCVALALALKALGKRAFVHLPGGMPTQLSVFECTAVLSDGGELPFAPQTAFAVDVSEYRRMDSGVPLFDACAHSCLIDHHGTNPGFGEVRVIDGSAAATGELVIELLDELGVTLTPEMAQWLYIAISTDSGQFSFSATSARTMEAAARCLAAGADADRICQVLFRTRSEGRTRLMGTVLSRFEMNQEKTMAWAQLTDADFAAAGATREDNDNLANELLQIQGVQFACIEEEFRGKSKFSLRSRGIVNVAKIAQPLGGGGHALAAGVTLDSPMDEALKLVLERAETALKENDKA